MRLERGQKPNVRRFQGPKAPSSRMQENSKELKWNLWRRRIRRTQADLPGFWGHGATNETRFVLVQEVPHAGEDHRHSEAVGSGDYFVVADRASVLDDGERSGFSGFFDAVGEREKGIGCNDASGKRRLRFHHRDFNGIDAAHLAGADADSGAVFCEDDGVGFDVLADFPGEAEGLHFFWRWGALGDDFQLVFDDFAEIGLL